MKFFYTGVSTFLIFLATSISAEIPVSTVEEVLIDLENRNLDNWSFQTIERHQSVFYKVRYHPVVNGIGEVELLEVDQKEPTEKQKKSFAKDHPDRTSNGNPNDGPGIYELIEPGSLEYVSSEGAVSYFTFAPRIAFDGEAKPFRELSGKIEWDNEENYPITYQISTKQTFKPKKGLKVKNFDIRFQFSKHENGAILLQSVHTQFKGKAFLVMTVEQDIETTFFDYRAPIIAEKD